MKKDIMNIEGVKALTTLEQTLIVGGLAGPSTSTSFWRDAAFVLGAVVKGFVVFGTEGGRNAGLTVH